MRSPLPHLTIVCAAALALATAVPALAGPPALDPANLDTTCAPCRDFFGYANGGWLRHATIPATQSRWGSFDELAERNRIAQVAILESAAADRAAKAGSERAMLGAFWTAAMDSARADAAGAKPIAPLLASVDRLRSTREIGARLGALHDQGLGGLFSFRAAQDPGASDVMIATAGQGGLGLPDRDYYFRDDSASRVIRAEYVAHVERAFVLAGQPPARAKADAALVMSLETELARASMTSVQRRDPKAVYNKQPLDSLRAAMPGFDWDGYLAARGAKPPAQVNVAQPAFFRAVGGLLESRTLAAWRAYLRWNVIDATSPYLSSAFAEEAFRFGRQLSGAKAQAPRWQRALRWTDGDLGDLLGRAYVKEHFPPAARERALTMVRNLEAALADRLVTLEWMSEATRQAALAKLQAFENKIGYPDTWRDYAGVTLARDALLANHLSARRYESRRNMARIGQPVERGEWSMTAPTVNAFYSSSLNSINFPAGILQPPFYDPSWDDATNYGGIGAVIGHEMTHGFDDRGRQFDARGNLRDWWTPEDAANYRARADQVAAQYAAYTVLDTLHLNGRLTLGENIADLGGVAIAYHALQRALAGQPRATLDGYTPEQRFFLSYAQIWRQVARDEAKRTQVQTDPHSPAVWRVNGTLSSLPEFEQAFGCRPGDPMVRDAAVRTRIW
jgi:putative endopeptidase